MTMKVKDIAIQSMIERGGVWYGYRSAKKGDVRFMKCGKGCACTTPPEILSADYRFVGKVDLKNKVIIGDPDND
jgi:hypothetical protein